MPREYEARPIKFSLKMILDQNFQVRLHECGKLGQNFELQVQVMYLSYIDMCLRNLTIFTYL